MIFSLLDSSQRDKHFDIKFIFLCAILTELLHFEILVTRDLSCFSNVQGPARAHFRQLELTKEQAELLIPIRPSEKYEESRNTVNKIAQKIVNNDYSSE